MESTTSFLFTSILIYLLNLFSIGGFPVSLQTVCEYYDPQECKKDCNSTILCELADSGKRSHCYALLTNVSGTIVLSKKGCWLDHFQCYNETKCVAKDEGKGNYYCCCEGSMCNVNVTINTTPRQTSPSTPVPVRSSNATVVNTLLCSLLPLFVITLVVILLFLFWRCRQPYYIEQFDAQRDKPLLPAPPPPSPPPTAHQNITLIKEKARGRFGLVYAAQMGDEVVAVKVCPLHDKQSWIVERDFYNMLHINRHDNILRFIAAEKHGCGLTTELWLITEYHDKGSLYDHLKGNTIGWNEARKIFTSMADGLAFLHGEIAAIDGSPGKPSISHRDLKSRNVLLKDNMTACLADFGLALVLDVNMGENLPGQVGTRRYMAPEVLDGSITFSPICMLKIDIYAFALVLWEVLSRCAAGTGMLKEYAMPFEEEVGQHPSLEDMQDVVVNKKLRPAIDNSWHQNEDLGLLCTTIEDCWDQDPEARLTAECICERLSRTSDYLSSSSFSETGILLLPLPSLSSKVEQSSSSTSSIDESSCVA